MGILLGLFVAANQLIVRGKAVGIWDADGQFFPYFVLVADHVRAGRFVTWDLWTHGGIPLMGDPQVGAFSPLMLAFGLAFGGTSLGFRAYWLTVWALGALGVFVLGRYVRAPAWGALIVALGFAFSGVYLSNAEHTPWLAAYSLLPFVVWRLDVALLMRRWGAAAEAGALWGLSALAGYPGVVLISGGLCVSWAVGRWAFPEVEATESHGARPVSLVQALGAVGVMVGVGLLVLSPTYLAFFYEGAGTQPRVGALAREVALSNQFDPRALATLFSPYLGTLKVDHAALWPSSDVSMVNVYMGAAIPLLALVAVGRRGRGGWRWWLAGIAVLSLSASMGESLPVRGWLYDLFLPMRYFRHSAIFRLFFVFGMTVLALYGARDASSYLRAAPRPSAKTFYMVVLGVVIIATFVFASYAGSAWEDGVRPWMAALGRAHFVAVWLGAAFVAWRLRGERSRYTVPVLLVLLAGTDALLTGVVAAPTVARMGSNARRWQALDAQHIAALKGSAAREPSACGGGAGTRRCKRNDQLITKTPVFEAYASEKNPFQQASAAHPVLRETATGEGRIWFSASPTFLEPTEEEFRAFVARADSLGGAPLMVHTPEAMFHSGESRAAIRGSAPPGAFVPLGEAPPSIPVRHTVQRYGPRHLDLTVEAPASGWVLVTDRWARSWRSEVNGQRVPTYSANFIFRAVPVTAGTNRIRFSFHPLAFPWLVWVSWGTLAAVGVGAASRQVRRRPPGLLNRSAHLSPSP